MISQICKTWTIKKTTISWKNTPTFDFQFLPESFFQPKVTFNGKENKLHHVYSGTLLLLLRYVVKGEGTPDNIMYWTRSSI